MAVRVLEKHEDFQQEWSLKGALENRCTANLRKTFFYSNIYFNKKLTVTRH